MGKYIDSLDFLQILAGIMTRISRFDDETRESFMSLYEKIDAGVGIPEGGSLAEESDLSDDEVTPETE